MCYPSSASWGDRKAAKAFNATHWLVELTPDMKVYDVTEEQLKQLVEKTNVSAQS